MSRTARIAGVALAGGVLAAAAIAVATRDAPPRRERPAVVEEVGAEPLRRELARCRTITMPDAGCERAWEAQRNHFFGRGDGAFAPAESDDAIGQDSDPPVEGAR